MFIVAVASAALIVLACGCSRTERVSTVRNEHACKVEFWPVGTDRLGPSETFYTEDVKFEGDRAVFIDMDTGRMVSLPSVGVAVTRRVESAAK